MTMPAEEIIQLDWRGMKCPQPIINTAKIARELGSRTARLRILADDEAFPIDLKAWAKSAKAEIIALQPQGDSSKVFEAIILINPQAQVAAAAATPAHASQSMLPAARAEILKTPAKSIEAAPAVAPLPASLDCVGMRCPEPVIALAKQARSASPGQVIQIKADDDAFPVDLKAWAKSAKAQILELRQDNGITYATVQTPGQPAAHQQTNPHTPPQALRAAHAAPHAEPSATAAPAPTPAPVSVAPAAAPAPATTQAAALSIDLTQASLQDLEQRLQAIQILGLTQGTKLMLNVGAVELIPSLTQWAIEHGHKILSLNTSSMPALISVELGQAKPSLNLPALRPVQEQALVPASAQEDRCTLLVLHNDLEALLAALMVANAAAAQQLKVEIFFSFWGVNLLRGEQPRQDAPKEPVSLAQRLFKFLMPKGPKRQALGQLNFGGMGSFMLGRIMKEKNVMPLDQMLQAAIDLDVQFTVCTMSMSVMGITKRDLMSLPNMEYAGVASFVEAAARSKMSMMF